MDKPELDNNICALVSTKRMFSSLLRAQMMILDDRVNKRDVLQLLSSVEHDVLMINDRNNHIDRDLFE